MKNILRSVKFTFTFSPQSCVSYAVNSKTVKIHKKQLESFKLIFFLTILIIYNTQVYPRVIAVNMFLQHRLPEVDGMFDIRYGHCVGTGFVIL